MRLRVSCNANARHRVLFCSFATMHLALAEAVASPFMVSASMLSASNTFHCGHNIAVDACAFSAGVHISFLAVFASCAPEVSYVQRYVQVLRAAQAHDHHKRPRPE